MVRPTLSPRSCPILTEDSNVFMQGCTAALPSPYGAALVSTGVVRLDKRAVAPDHDKTGTF